ncbi:MAG: hypothetical protein NZ772_04565 [Cyanobacteria bacterium]|nr:hypothetical protein [Cyanobacteriota bacterium]MDW8200675.1 hypothetical protein [Cyanobacteriota bacterium SKYGB_h_bin112]
MTKRAGARLERYTIRCPDEVLIVTAEVNGELDQVMIFKGFSSSLMRPTDANPDVPILPESANILYIDRLRGPYTPASPHYLEQGISWEVMQQRLTDMGE